MTDIVGSMAVSRQVYAGAVAESLYLDPQQEAERNNWEWSRLLKPQSPLQ